MVIASAILELEMPDNTSLKDKRRVLKSVMARLRNEFNVAAAEVGAHDHWQRGLIGLVTVSTEAGHAHSLLEKAVAAVEEWRLDCTLASYEIDLW